ncbi:CopG family transcriptional regulator [Patescibacteria group bacterium]|nr:CopG family transcriptional regulator [Patescibacteria group bacterium]
MSKGSPKVSKKEKIPVTFSSHQIGQIEKYKGILGNTKAEIIRNIVIYWILDKKNNEKNEN